MKSVVAGVGAVFFFAVTFSALIVLGAYPTKWLVNYLFTPSILLSVLGTAKIGFWQAAGLNFLTGSVSKGIEAASTISKKKKVSA